MKRQTKYIECDRAMAEKKRMFPCNKRCSECIAGIKTDEDGYREHVKLQWDANRRRKM